VVAGTHGKTSSTALLAWVLEQAGRDPSLMVGGESLDFGGNYKLGHGEWFVIEGDEYDTAFFDKGPKFLHYRPQALLLTAVEFDHADIYRDVEHVKQAFRQLIGISAGCGAAAGGRGLCVRGRGHRRPARSHHLRPRRGRRVARHQSA